MHTRTRAHPREIRQRVLTPSTERKSHPARHRNGWWSFGLHDGLLSVNEGVISRWGSRRAEVAVSRPREKFPSRSGRLAEPGVTRPNNGLSAIGDVELGEDVGHIVGDRL